MGLNYKISVIIPAYNVAQWLPRCIESVLGQTYQNLEILLIDDGSTDDTVSIIDAYAEKDPRIIAIHQENHGVSHARNQGLLLATGDLIAFIDSDDALEPDMHELLVQVMEAHNADISHCGYKHIVRDEIRLVHDTRRILPQSRDEALCCLVGGRLFDGGLWNKLFRREVLSGLRFREGIRMNEDILFCFEAFCRAEKTVFADYALYHYYARIGESAVFTVPDEKKLTDSVMVNREIYQRLRDTKLHDIAAERYIRTLSGYYLFCMDHKCASCREIASEIQTVADSADSLGRNMTATVLMIRYCPWLYRLVRRVYSKIRKPHWEARKDKA